MRQIRINAVYEGLVSMMMVITTRPTTGVTFEMIWMGDERTVWHGLGHGLKQNSGNNRK